ncbi:MAG: DUF4387 domain-containing protein [Gaiellales bacterium]|nr:DUF4387 domain-containing protein [Gaiellales bacterium]
MSTAGLPPSTETTATAKPLVPLTTLAAVIRSKNSGPFELTLDVFFRSESIYQRAKARQIISAALIAGLYGVPPESVLDVVYFDAAAAVKVTLARPVSSGSPRDTDVYGAQQHMPLADALVPWEVAANEANAVA